MSTENENSNVTEEITSSDAVDSTQETTATEQYPLPPALSKDQAMRYWGYKDGVLKMRRHRAWEEGIHYGKDSAGEIVYYKEEIDLWRQSGHTEKKLQYVSTTTAKNTQPQFSQNQRKRISKQHRNK